MSNVISDLRQAIEAHLATALAGVDVAGGRPDTGLNRDPQPKVRIWHPGYTPKPSNQTLAKPTFILRYLPTLSKQPSTTSPRDQSALEQAEVDLLAAFTAKNRAGDFIDNVAVAVTNCVISDDADRWYVELTLTALMLNLAQPAA